MIEIFQTEGAKVKLFLDGPEWDGHPSATLGGMSCQDKTAGDQLIEQVIRYAQGHGIHRLIGPMDGDTWHSYRFVTESDDTPAFLMEPAQNDIALAVLRDAGFVTIGRYFSAKVPLDVAGLVIPPKTDAFTIEYWDGSNAEALFTQVHDLSTRAFAQNAFYKPIGLDDFLAMYMPMVPMLKKELIFFARKPDGELAGFLFGTPNYAEGPQPQSVILKTYASLAKGAGQHLAYGFHKAAHDLGYHTAIHALIHEDNLSGLRSSAEGANIFRRYELFGLKFNG